MELVEQAQAYVTRYMREHFNPKLLYHNLTHTENVVAVAHQLGQHYKLAEGDLCILLIAAWFHDTGYFQDFLHHEAISADLAEQFLKAHGASTEVVQAVRNCILATQMPQRPTTLLEEILCDADLSHLGTKAFWASSKLLRKEAEWLGQRKIAKQEWQRKTIQFLEQHHYHTRYCKTELNKMKDKNLERLRKKQEQPGAAVSPISALLHSQASPVAGTGGKASKEDRSEKTIETMFRITSANSQRLSDQADTKAHIMISVNSIIISVLLSVVVRRMDEHINLTIPIIMILAVNLLTIVFAILATRPNIPAGRFTPTDLQEKRTNLLFFGNFYRMSFDAYANGMFEVMKDSHFLKLSLLRDLYGQGVVLGRKYRMLKIAYNIFMFGLIVSVIVFFIAARY